MVNTGLNYRRHSIFTEDQIKKLFENSATGLSHMFQIPHACLRMDKDVWLISELYEQDSSVAFGLYMDNAKAVLGIIDLSAFEKYKSQGQLVYNDDTFETTNTISTFQKVANELGRITIDENYFSSLFNKYKL